MNKIVVSSSLIAIHTKEALSPAMRAVIWEIGAALDEARIPPGHREPVWLTLPTSRLRGDAARDDNQHLRTTLDRLCGIYLTGDHKGDQWGTVLLAEWHIIEGGSIAQILVPPAAVAAIQAPQTFAKVEARAAHSLSGHGRQLYVLLADKKNLRQWHWTFTVDELRSLMGVADKKAYRVWAQFQKRVLKPALAQVNDFGTVSVKMTTKRLGRSVQWVRFDWRWKDPREAIDLAAENERHSAARGRRQSAADAPPLAGDEAHPEAQAWWDALPPERQAEARDRLRTAGKGTSWQHERSESQIIERAAEDHGGIRIPRRRK